VPDPTTDSGGGPGARALPALLALAAFALHALCDGRYGIFRDELYE